MFFLTLFLENFDFYWLIFEFKNNLYLSLSYFFSLTSFLSFFYKLVLILLSSISSNMVSAFTIALKFLLCIALLIFARGGIPRFRFDYLTKLG